MEVEHHPRLVLIVADGPLIAGDSPTLAGRSAIHLPVASPPLRSAAIATTLATGVSPLVHGIVTRNTVDWETLQVRETRRNDRRFQTFWDGTDLEVKLINWPATSDDNRVTNYISQQEFEEAKNCLDADVVGVLLPRVGRERTTPTLVQTTQQELETFLSLLSPKTHVVILHRRTQEDGSKLESLRVFGATFLVNDCEFETNSIPHLELVGAAVYLLAGVPCPTGVKQPSWAFLNQFELETERPFPLRPIADEVDWANLIQKLVETSQTGGIKLLTQRFTTMVSVAFKKELWEELEYNSFCLAQLEGKPFALWMLILALEQQGKIEALQSAIDGLERQYPKIYITSIAKSLLQFDAEKSKETLKKIDITKVGVYHAIGVYGRLCLKAGLIDLGRDALKLAMQRGVSISADRAQLAQHYYENEQFKEALTTLRSVGLTKGELSWQVLRLKILVSLNHRDEVVHLARQILEQNSTHEVALKALESFS